MGQYYSQIGQDQYYIENISKKKQGGIFLDIGANDGIFESNTAALEFDYNWTGICVEANPSLIENLKKIRPNSKIVNCAVWDSPGEIELEISNSNHKGIRGDLLSRISNLDRNQDYFKKHFSENRNIIKVKTRTITDIIMEYFSNPVTIDYMSLDVEGAEMEALRGIDFSLIDIKFMTVEHGNREGYINLFYNHLKNFGYKIHRLNKWDVEFIK
jgi:FkbM family methyltransferase